MTFLPIVARELRVRARQGTTYWGRCAAATVSAIVAMESVVSYARAVNPAALGALTFSTLSWVGLAVACASVLMTADSISGERREGALSLLFLTELEGKDIILGKLVAARLVAFYVLVCFVPGLALALLCGGITAGTLARTVLALLNAVFIALAAGLWVSARMRGREKTMLGAVLLVALLFGLPWLLTLKGPTFNSGTSLLALLSPYGAFRLSPDAAYAPAPAQFWFSLCLAHCEGWLLLHLATKSLERTWRETQLEERPTPKPKSALIAEQRPTPAPNKALLEQDPVCWVASRVPGRTTLIWGGTLLLLICVLFGTLFLPLAVNFLSSFNLFLSLASASAFAWLAGRFFFDARRSGELELLLSTPMGARDIVGGYWWAVWRHLRSPLLLVAFVTFVEFLFLFVSNVWSAAGLNVFQIVLGPLNRALDVVAVSWVGMWFGLRARKPFMVVAWTVGLVVGLPWLAAYLLIIISSSRGAAGLGGLATSTFWFTGWPLLYLFKNILIIRWAAAELQQELRATAPLALGDWLKEDGRLQVIPSV